jgi:hypothetical protein
VFAADAGALTIERLRILATAAEAMRLRDARYPPLEELDNGNLLIVMAYIRDQPYRDAWGKEFRFTLSDDSKHLTIRSAGPNRKFESCGDDLATRDGKSICPASASVVLSAASIQRYAAKLTMRELGAIWAAIYGYQHAHGALPSSLDAVKSEAVNYSVDPFPERDAWGKPYRYELAADRRHYLISSGDGTIAYDGTTYVRGPRGLAGALDWMVWPSEVRPTMQLKINRPLADSEVIEAPNGRLGFAVTITAPVDDADVEHPEVQATNLAPGYFAQHPEPNVFITTRLVSAAAGEAAPLPITTAGGGGSASEQVREISLQLPGSGLWEIIADYKPKSGAYAGQTLTRQFRAHVP